MSARIKPAADSLESELSAEFAREDFPFESILTPELKREIEAAARATIEASREKISLRIPKADLAKLKARAAEEGMPYQTLINSILHKYVSR